MTRSSPDTETLPVHSEDDVVRVRQSVRQHAVLLGFSLIEQTKLVTAASELARNTLVHGHGGEVKIERLTLPRAGLRLTFLDHGPGIPDLELAMQDGYTTGGGLGLGLSGSRRLVNEFGVHSRPGETQVSVVKWKS